MQGVHSWRLVPPLPARQEHRPHHIQVHHHHDGFQCQDGSGYDFEDDDVFYDGCGDMMMESSKKRSHSEAAGTQYKTFQAFDIREFLDDLHEEVRRKDAEKNAQVTY